MNLTDGFTAHPLQQSWIKLSRWNFSQRPAEVDYSLKFRKLNNAEGNGPSNYELENKDGKAVRCVWGWWFRAMFLYKINKTEVNVQESPWRRLPQGCLVRHTFWAYLVMFVWCASSLALRFGDCRQTPLFKWFNIDFVVAEAKGCWIVAEQKLQINAGSPLLISAASWKFTQIPWFLCAGLLKQVSFDDPWSCITL